jgi:hypothetical protein
MARILVEITVDDRVADVILTEETPRKNFEKILDDLILTGTESAFAGGRVELAIIAVAAFGESKGAHSTIPPQ